MARRLQKRRRTTGVRETKAPASGDKPERWGRFRHAHKHTTDHQIGDYTIEYWRLGDVKLLPESHRAEAEGKGYEFLGWAEP